MTYRAPESDGIQKWIIIGFFLLLAFGIVSRRYGL